MTDTDIVVDTDAVSFLFRGDSRIQFCLPFVLNHRSIISFMTVAELEFGVLRANWGESRRKSLADFVRQHFVIFNQTTDLCNVWAKLRVEAERKGRHLSSSDAWIAATAVLLEVPLLTYNQKDYESLDSLQLISANEGE
jgi:predicted nucleic acid-binding protein